MKIFFVAVVFGAMMLITGCQERAFSGSNNYTGILKVGTNPFFDGSFVNVGNGTEIIAVMVASVKDDRVAASGLQENDQIAAIDYIDRPDFSLFSKACLAVSTGKVKHVVLTVKRNGDVLKVLVAK